MKQDGDLKRISSEAGNPLKFRNLVIGITFIAIFTMAVRVSVDTDTWWHLRAGEWILENNEILREDPFSLTRLGDAWRYPGWIAQVIFFSIYNLFSVSGLNVFTAIIVLIAFIVLFQSLQGHVLLRAAVLIFAAVVSAVYWSARPHIFTFLFSAYFIFVLEEFRLGKRNILWTLPIVMAVWANVHGGFAIGFILLITYLIGEFVNDVLKLIKRDIGFNELWAEQRRTYAIYILIGLLCAGAVFLNPHGPSMLLYPFKTISIGVLHEYIQEWQSPDFHQLEVQPFVWMLLALLAAFTATKKRVHPVEFFLVAGFAFMGLMAARNIAIFALVAAPVLARHTDSAIQPYLAGSESRKQVPAKTAKILNIALLLVITIAAIFKISIPLQDETNMDAIKEQVPINATAFLKETNPEGNLFNSYNWGGYVIWDLYPEYFSFVDGRTDLFDDEILTEYISAWRADPNWREILHDWNIQLTLLEPGSPLNRVLEEEGWEAIYSDEFAVIRERP